MNKSIPFDQVGRVNLPMPGIKALISGAGFAKIQHPGILKFKAMPNGQKVFANSMRAMDAGRKKNAVA